MIALIFGALLVCQAALAYPSPYPGPYPAARPVPDAYIGAGYPGYPYGGGYAGGYGCVEEVITPPVVPPVLNTVDVYDIATLGVIPAPPVEYVYPAVGYEAFGLGGCDGTYGNYPYRGVGYPLGYV